MSDTIYAYNFNTIEWTTFLMIGLTTTAMAVVTFMDYDILEEFNISSAPAPSGNAFFSGGKCNGGQKDKKNKTRKNKSA